MSRRSIGVVLVAAALALAGCGADRAGGPDAGTSAETSDVTVYVVRHGETVFNRIGVMQGWSDSPLTPEGEDLADRAGEALADHDFVAAYVSDLGRTRQTAEHILAGQDDAPEPTYLPELREWNFGGFEGNPNDDAWGTALGEHGYEWSAVQADMGSFVADVGSLTAVADFFADSDPLGLAEDADAIRDRLAEGFTELIEDARAQGGGDVLVVSHGLAIGSLLEYLDPGFEPTQFHNLALSVIEVDEGTTTIVSSNDTDYLDDAA
jgi:broad specificity phosphatase PhoE